MLRNRLDDLQRGTGPLVTPEITDAMRTLGSWRTDHHTAEDVLRNGPRRRVRHEFTQRLKQARTQVDRWQEHLDRLLEPIEQSVRDEIDQLEHNIEKLDVLRTDRDRRVRSLGIARVAGIDRAIRGLERTPGVEIDHGLELDNDYGIEL